MRKLLILPLAALLIACSDSPELPAWAGTWYLHDPIGPLEITFHVAKKNTGTQTYNAEIIHPAIPEEHWRANNMFAHDEFKNGNGYGRIEIVSRGDFFYRVTLIYSRFVDEGDKFMDVYDVLLEIQDEDPIALPDRHFILLSD